GNIYAAEALFLAGVHPWTPAGAVDGWAALGAGLVQTFTDSLAREQDEEIRYLQEGAASPFLVYGREGEACPRCATPITRTAQQGRSTFWCPGCQPPRA
ncbi:MAG: formamidopyrimidine-DNA glycosylase, partial [Myxococcales bacterium]|nr:formamidopyrimidine-DNA glycosylase [Myxococcales bacterium]